MVVVEVLLNVVILNDCEAEGLQRSLLIVLFRISLANLAVKRVNHHSQVVVEIWIVHFGVEADPLLCEDEAIEVQVLILVDIVVSCVILEAMHPLLLSELLIDQSLVIQLVDVILVVVKVLIQLLEALCEELVFDVIVILFHQKPRFELVNQWQNPNDMLVLLVDRQEYFHGDLEFRPIIEAFLKLKIVNIVQNAELISFILEVGRVLLVEPEGSFFVVLTTLLNCSPVNNIIHFEDADFGLDVEQWHRRSELVQLFHIFHLDEGIPVVLAAPNHVNVLCVVLEGLDVVVPHFDLHLLLPRLEHPLVLVVEVPDDVHFHLAIEESVD